MPDRSAPLFKRPMRWLVAWALVTGLIAAPVAVSPWFITLVPLALPFVSCPAAVLIYQSARANDDAVGASLAKAISATLLLTAASMFVGASIGFYLANMLGHEAHFR